MISLPSSTYDYFLLESESYSCLQSLLLLLPSAYSLHLPWSSADLLILCQQWTAFLLWTTNNNNNCREHKVQKWDGPIVCKKKRQRRRRTDKESRSEPREQRTCPDSNGIRQREKGFPCLMNETWREWKNRELLEYLTKPNNANERAKPWAQMQAGTLATSVSRVYRVLRGLIRVMNEPSGSCIAGYLAGNSAMCGNVCI